MLLDQGNSFCLSAVFAFKMLADMPTLNDFSEIYQEIAAGSFATQLTSVGKFVINS